MKRLNSKIAELLRREKGLSPNGHLSVETCLSGNPHGSFDGRINLALLAANDEEKHGIFRDLLSLWFSIQSEDRHSEKRRQAESILGPTLCSCICGRVEPIIATITATECQVRVWRGLPCDIGPDSVKGIERPVFSVEHTYHPETIAPYVKTVLVIMDKPVLASGKKTDVETRFDEIRLSNGTRILMPVRLN